MRLIIAMICFVVAALMMSLGIAQRTLLLKPDHVDAAISIGSTAPVTVIDGAALNAYPRSQNVTLAGSEKVFAAYGRTADVLAWVEGSSYNDVSFDPTTKKLTNTIVPAAAIGDMVQSGNNNGSKTDAVVALPTPAGSDLWLEEFTGANTLGLTINVPVGVSLIVLADGTAPAPGTIGISWPLDNSTPLAIPLMIGGGIVLINGLIFLVWAINRIRVARGPRRKQPKMPRVPKPPKFQPSRPKAVKGRPRDRRVSGLSRTAIIPLLLGVSLALSGCSVQSIAEVVAPTPAPTATPSADAAAALQAPAVTVPQAKRIIAKIVETVTTADKNRDAALIATRFDGPALQVRLANYRMLRADSKIPALPPIPAGTVEIVLPQQSDTWPRAVFAVIKDAKDAKVAPTALMLIQQDPRSQYKVHYAVTLESGSVIPPSAPAVIGTTRMGADQKLLKITPQELAPAYGDILAIDQKSKFYPLFQVDGDSLRTAIGAAFKAKRIREMPSTARLTFSHEAGKGEIVALSTNDAGAIVAVDLNETETVRPREVGAAINAPASVKALLGKGMSTRGIRAVYGQQLLFYVPAAGSAAKIVLLGYSQGMIAASEL